jgi:hypothetical protein
MGNGPCSPEDEDNDEEPHGTITIQKPVEKPDNEEEWTIGMVPLWGENWGYVEGIKSQ